MQKNSKLLRSLYRPRPHVSGYFWIHSVFFPRRPSVHTHPVLIRTVLNPLSRVESFESATCIRIRVDSKSGYLFIQWCNKIDLSFLPTVNTVFTWQPLLMLCYQYSQRRLASSVPGSEIVGSAELRKLEHVSTNQIKVLRLRLTFFEDFDQSGF